MKNKKGFTLIELLAVIVILAIIALIAVPIVLNIINGSRESATKVSVQNYMDAVEQAVAKNMLTSKTDNIDGTYIISDNGKIIENGTSKIKVSYSGKGLESGTLKIEKGKVIEISNGKIDNKIVSFSNNQIKINNYKESELMVGIEFNVALKNFVENSQISSGDDWILDNGMITYIGFYSNGNLPNGYTKDKLKKLKNIDLSNNQDNSISAYVEETSDNKVKVYVYSENQIKANSDSGRMFEGFSGVSSIYLSELNTSGVYTMNSMFNSTSSSVGMKSLDLSNFDTSDVEYMENMFCNSNIETVNLSSFNTSKVVTMKGMFKDNVAMTTVDLSSFDTNNVQEYEYMLYGELLNTIIISKKWTLPKSSDEDPTSSMFQYDAVVTVK